MLPQVLLYSLIAAALIAQPRVLVAQTKKTPPQDQKMHQPPPKGTATPNPPPKGSEKEPEATNTGLCHDLAERATGWDRTITEFAKAKAHAEVELDNCRMQEKDRKTLPHQCDQYQQQIEGFRKELKQAEEGKTQTREAWEKYRCR